MKFYATGWLFPQTSEWNRTGQRRQSLAPFIIMFFNFSADAVNVATPLQLSQCSAPTFKPFKSFRCQQFGSCAVQRRMAPLR